MKHIYSYILFNRENVMIYIFIFLKITIRVVEVRLELFSIYSIVFPFCKINARLYVGSHDGSNVVTILCWRTNLSAQWFWSRLLWRQLVEKFTLYQQSFWYGQNSKEYFILLLSVTNFIFVNGLLLIFANLAIGIRCFALKMLNAVIHQQ